MVSVDVKHHVYLLTYELAVDLGPRSQYLAGNNSVLNKSNEQRCEAVWPSGILFFSFFLKFTAISGYTERSCRMSYPCCTRKNLESVVVWFVSVSLSIYRVSSPGSTFCADSYFGIRSTPVLPQ